VNKVKNVPVLFVPVRKRMDNKEDNLQLLHDSSSPFIKAMKEIEDDSEKFWYTMSKEDQLKVFCAVVRRIHKAELEDRRSYRGALYNVFGFGPEAYAQAQMSGYLDIHNAIYEAIEKELDDGK